MNDIKRAANNAANTSPSKWIEMLARLGYAAKGLVYIIVGFLPSKPDWEPGLRSKTLAGLWRVWSMNRLARQC